VGGGGLVGGGGFVGNGVAVGGTKNVAVGDKKRVTGMEVGTPWVGSGMLVPGVTGKGVMLAGPAGVLLAAEVAVTMIGPEVALGAPGVTAIWRGAVPHRKKPRQ
jgi:hypothetical protein